MDSGDHAGLLPDESRRPIDLRLDKPVASHYVLKTVSRFTG